MEEDLPSQQHQQPEKLTGDNSTLVLCSGQVTNTDDSEDEDCSGESSLSSESAEGDDSDRSFDSNSESWETESKRSSDTASDDNHSRHCFWRNVRFIPRTLFESSSDDLSVVSFENNDRELQPVSYTHLTLPTILLV